MIHCPTLPELSVLRPGQSRQVKTVATPVLAPQVYVALVLTLTPQGASRRRGKLPCTGVTKEKTCRVRGRKGKCSWELGWVHVKELPEAKDSESGRVREDTERKRRVVKDPWVKL